MAKNAKPDFKSIAQNLRAALSALIWQTEQMAGMFPDEDNTIKTAIADANAAIAKATKAFNTEQGN